MQSNDITGYYIDHFFNCKKPYICENCNKEIYRLTSSNIAHILPKNVFKSVSLEYYNYLLLCGDCHGTFDSSYSKAITMPCFTKALQRYNIFKSSIKENHKILNFFQ